MQRRRFLGGLAAVWAAGLGPEAAALAERTAGLRLAAAASKQLGVTTGYDPDYARIAYPMGDLPRTTGVCADVVVRAARDGLGLALPQLVHEDMARNFAAYPATWHLRAPDSNIDHRRVLNLEVYWRRQGAQVWGESGHGGGNVFPKPMQVGDELTWLLGGKLPHVGVVVATGPLGTTVVHNIGRGVEAWELFLFHGQEAKGHFRWPAA